MTYGIYGNRKDIDELTTTVNSIKKVSFDSTKSFEVKSNVSAITYKDSKFTPDTITFTSYSISKRGVDLFTGGELKLYGSVDNATGSYVYIKTGSNGKVIAEPTTTYNYYRAVLTIEGVTKDFQTVPVLKDNGENGITLMLDNEAVVFPTSSVGLLENDIIVSIPFHGYYGLNLTPTQIITIDLDPLGTGDVTILERTDGTSSNPGLIKLKFLNGSSLQGLSEGKINITFKIQGNTVVKTFNYAKANKGVNGQDGKDGKDGKSISNIVNEYALNNDKTKAPTSGWSTTPSTPTSTNQYLWNREKITYSDSTTSTTNAHICATYIEDGKGIQSITEYYATSKTYTVPTTGWDTNVPTLSSINKYLWNYEYILYTDSTYTETSKRVIGVYGDTGEKGVDGVGREYIYKRTTTETKPSTPSEPAKSVYNVDDYIPSGWTDDAQGVNETYPYEWILERVKFVPTGSPTAEWESYTKTKDGVTKTASLWAKYGKDGESIDHIKNYYKADSRSSGVPKSEITSETIPTLTETNKYLWNYEKTFDSAGTLINETDPHIVAMYSKDGRTIISITEKYGRSKSESEEPAESEWKDNISDVPLTAEYKYLWVKETVTYNTGSPTILKHIIAIYGEDGKGKEFIFARTQHKEAPSVTDDPSGGKIWSDDDFVPAGWNDDALDTTEEYPYQWVLTRNKIDGVWQKYSTRTPPKIWSIWDGLQFKYVTVDELENILNELKDNSHIEEKIPLKGTDTLTLRKDKYSSVITGYLDIADSNQYSTSWEYCGTVTNSLFIPGSNIKFSIYDGSAYRIGVIALETNLTSGKNIKISFSEFKTYALNTFFSYFQMKSASDTKPVFVYKINGANFKCENVTMFVNKGEQYYFYIYDKNQSGPISGASIQLTINGVTYSHTSDSNGKVSRTINLNPGRYQITIKYTGNKSSYAATTITTYLSVMG